MIVILLVISALCCKEPPEGIKSAPKNTDLVTQILNNQVPSTGFSYDLNAPFIELKLENKLKEISGITYNMDTGEIISINDEKGNLYIVDLETGVVSEKIDFGYGGDYEGVELVNGMVYVVKSDGNLYQWDLSNQQAGESLKTRLTYSNNIEGLGYDPNTNNLLLACKDAGSLSKEDKVKGKAVYSFSISKKRLNTKPIFSIRDKELTAWFAKDHIDPESDKKLKNRLHSFSPSGIAVHPVSGDYYIVSAKGHTLIVTDQKGQIKHIALLSKSLEQPEGICFDSQGTMYISSEGVKNAARIFGYEMMP